MGVRRSWQVWYFLLFQSAPTLTITLGKRLVPDMREICKMTVDLDMNYIDIEETLLANRQTSYKLNCIIAVNFGSITSRATVSWKKKDVCNAI
jgi:hypothetical protein